MKQICAVSDIFSLERPNCFLLDNTICSIISCILSFNAAVWRVSSSTWSCIPRKSCTSSDLSSIFSCSSVYLNVITGNSCIFSGYDYNRYSVLPPLSADVAFVIMTVDNTAEKSWPYDFSAVLSTQEVHPCPNIGAVCTKKAATVDNYSKMLKLKLSS